jgi:hypothetical protein
MCCFCLTQSARAGSQKGLDSWLSTAVTPTAGSAGSSATHTVKAQQSNGTAASSPTAAAAAVTNGSSSGGDSGGSSSMTVSPPAAAAAVPAAATALAAAAPDVDPCVNTAIRCPHGALTHNRKLWRLISATAWRKIVDVYGDTVLEFNPADGVCPICEVEVSTSYCYYEYYTTDNTANAAGVALSLSIV